MEILAEGSEVVIPPRFRMYQGAFESCMEGKHGNSGEMPVTPGSKRGFGW